MDELEELRASPTVDVTILSGPGLDVDLAEGASIDVAVTEGATVDVELSDGPTIDVGITEGPTITVELGDREGTSDYERLNNKPRIEGVELIGDLTFPELHLRGLTNIELEAMLQL